MKWTLIVALMLVVVVDSFSQEGNPKVLIFNDIRTIDTSDLLIVDSDTLVIGPYAELNVEGIIEIRSAFILVHPTARVQGSGLVKIVSPELIENGSFNQHRSTIIDGNGNLNFDVKIEVWNKANLVLDKVTHAFFESDNYESNDFYTDANLSLMEDGVCVELRGNRLTLGYNAIIESFSPNRMIISDENINSVLSKKIRANLRFEFPIGFVEGDYSPVAVQPEKDAQFFVSLVRISMDNKEISFRKKEGGINRVWGVYADHNVRTNYFFKHSKSDVESLAISSQMEIFQYSELNEWKLMTSSYLKEEEHSTKNLSSMYAKVSKNYFSKFRNIGSKPKSEDDYVKLKEGQEAVISILANDKGGDGKIVAEKTKIVERPKNGFVEVLLSGEVRYQPVNGFIGSDFFVYEISDEFGLTSQSTVFLTVGDDVFFLLSNVLTPNGDGYNDQFVFVGRENLLNLELIIVNRWGDRLYENKAYDNTWEGVGLNGGTYYYIVKGKKMDGNVIQQKGWVLLSK